MSSRKEQKEQARLAREQKERELAAQSARTRRMTIIGGVFGLALVAVVVAVIVSSGAFKSKNVSGADTVASRFAGIPQRGVELGEKNAPATLEEFADLKCPFCREFALNSLPTLVSDYVKTGKMKIIFRNVTILDQNTPGTPDSTNAATFAAATGFQNKLWNFVDLFYINQKDEATTYVTDKYLRQLGNQVSGLDVNKAFQDRGSKAVTAQLDLAKAGYTKNGAPGTPYFLVGPTNGKLQNVELSDLGDPSPITDIVDSLQPGASQ